MFGKKASLKVPKSSISSEHSPKRFDIVGRDSKPYDGLSGISADHPAMMNLVTVQPLNEIPVFWSAMARDKDGNTFAVRRVR